MSTEHNDGGPAFPSEVDGYNISRENAVEPFKFTGVHPGMTLRDWFAGQALAALLSHHGDACWHPDAQIQSRDGAADTAYGYADAMLAARATNKGAE